MPVKLAIDARGTGTGEPLVLLHGLGANRLVWRRAAPRLARERLVLCPDIPGLGGSPPAGPGFRLDEVAATLADALAERARGPFDLLGTSLGGAVAVYLAVQRPELVRRLVLAAPAGFTPWPWPLAAAGAGAVSERAIALRRGVGARVAGSATVRRTLLFGAVAEPERLSAGDARLLFEASRGSERIGAALKAVLRADLRPLLDGVEAPLGLIWGERDRVVPISTLSLIRGLRPDAVVETIPRAAHIPQLERPAEFAAAVRRVLDALA
ncbi:MAG TPA: alpha/beta fold hydrolase [Solirubrobacteraceae bacterium]|nr:alpha/beta fold hydrolase [Solirubrobacteraceae bacterium]